MRSSSTDDIREVPALPVPAGISSLDENGQNETGEVYLYSFSRTADGDPMLANIEDDEEYDAAANAFNAVVEKARADEEADAPLS